MPIPQDDDIIELLVNNNETVQSIGDTKELSKDQQIKIDASAKGVKWLFGLLEGCTWEALGAGPDQYYRFATLDPQPIHEARALADKYDLEFFDSILAQTLLRLASTHPKPAATVVGVAFAMDDQVLCEYAVAHLAPHQNPPRLMSCEFTKAIGPAAMGALASAYLMCESFCPCHHHRDPDGCAKRAWTGSREQWAELARYMPRTKIWISKWHK